MTVSLPPQMMRKVEQVRKTEQRTRSELVREALRLYFNPELAARIARLPVYTPTAAERRAIAKGRAQLARGHVIPAQMGGLFGCEPRTTTKLAVSTFRPPVN